MIEIRLSPAFDLSWGWISAFRHRYREKESLFREQCPI
jgi:hypothetical protein